MTPVLLASDEPTEGADDKEEEEMVNEDDRDRVPAWNLFVDGLRLAVGRGKRGAVVGLRGRLGELGADDGGVANDGGACEAGGVVIDAVGSPDVW